MNSQHARVAFRDRAVVDVLDLALRFLVVQARSYAKVGLVVLVPSLAIVLAAGKLLGWPAAWGIALPVALLAELPFTVLASRLVFEERVRARDVLVSAAVALPRLAVARFLSIAAIAIALCLLVVPGVWLAASLLFLGEVLLLERGPRTIARTERLASHGLDGVLLALVTLALLPVLAVLFADVAGRGLLGELFEIRPPLPIWRSYGGVLPALGLVAQVPFRATTRFFVYLNVRTRVEGWDIQNRFVRIATAPDR